MSITMTQPIDVQWKFILDADIAMLINATEQVVLEIQALLL